MKSKNLFNQHNNSGRLLSPAVERFLSQAAIILFYILLFFAVSFFSRAIYKAENQAKSSNTRLR